MDKINMYLITLIKLYKLYRHNVMHFICFYRVYNVSPIFPNNSRFLMICEINLCKDLIYSKKYY